MRVETKADNRKKMAESLAGHLGEECIYSGAPGFAYQFGKLTVNRDGSITGEGDEDKIRAFLIKEGFVEDIPTELNIKIPAEDLSSFAIKNLVFMLASREYLLNKAAGGEYFAVSEALVKILQSSPEEDKAGLISKITEDDGLTGVTIEEDAVTFTFPHTDAVKDRAFTELAAAMIKKARVAKRIRPDRHTPENEKYYFRMWLIQLGFGGAEMKESRLALTKGLTGYAAFKNDEEADAFKAKLKEKRRAEKEGGAK